MDKFFSLSRKAGFFLLLFGSPLALDIALVRYKLWLIEIATLWLVTIWLLNLIYQGKLVFRKSSLTLPVFLYGGLVLVFWLVAPQRAVVQDEFIRMLLSLGLYFVALEGSKDYDFALKGWFAATFLVCLYGVGQRLGFHLKFLKWEKVLFFVMKHQNITFLALQEYVMYLGINPSLTVMVPTVVAMILQTFVQRYFL